MHSPDVGETLPAFEGESIAHGRVSLPGDIPAGNWAVIFSYRANW